MLAKETVFVIGAGCSFEFDLPLGNALRDAIYKAADGEARTGDLLSAALAGSGIRGANVNIAHRMRALARGVHAKPSIDQYLDFHQADEAQVFVGKLAIARCILEAERKSKLSQENLKRGFDGVQDTWLMQLWNVMNEGVRPENVGQAFENVTFVCFNYDRCIEQFFFNAVSALTGRNDADVVPALRSLNVLHVYGSLAPLRWQAADNGFTYEFGGALDEPSWLQAMARNIRTFTEAADSNTVGRIKDALANAERVCFLGFSYLEQNLELMRLEPGRARIRELFTNAYGMPTNDAIHGHNLAHRVLVAEVDGVQSKQTTYTASEFMWHHAGAFRR
jgi:hypothetical protein